MKEIYQLKITLADIKPAPWRRISVYSDTPLEDLHKIIQTAMGWTNSHLHQFVHNKKYFCLPHEDDSPSEAQVDYSGTKLNGLLSEAGQTMVYEYDLGDGWRHQVKLEKTLPPDAKTKYPVCAAGECSCPPEDCGGPHGFQEILEAFKKPKSKESEEVLEWLGDDYDPTAFDLEEINKRLKKKNYGCADLSYE